MSLMNSHHQQKTEEVAEQKVETIAKEIPIEADTKLDVPKPSLKKKKTFAAYEIEDNNSLSNENDMAIIGLSQKVNDDDDQTVFSDDGKPTGVVKKMKQNRKSDSSYRKNNRRDISNMTTPKNPPSDKQVKQVSASTTSPPISSARRCR